MIYSYKNYNFLAGTDEVGRGCIAGPVVAAAVILPKTIRIKGLNDSKLLNHVKRKELEINIKSKAISYSISFVDNIKIDEINILNASHLAMANSLSNLSLKPDFLLVDGNSFLKDTALEYECVVKGDGKFACIAAASILAKVARDEYMIEISKEYPGYSWKSNKGYPTSDHIIGIKKLGFTPIHRRSFKLKAFQYQLHFK